MKVGIVGSRDYPFLDRVRAYVEQLPSHAVVISGGARGVDSMAVGVARARGLSYVEWKVLDRHDGWYGVERFVDGVFDHALMQGTRPWVSRSFAAAAHRRNTCIADEAEQMTVFWDGRSPGTRDTLLKAQARGLPITGPPPVSGSVGWEG